ncbi:hypothetical protein [uncultured Prochlorococcus sp.]|uniref:hypothetical protein n=1 Tax=uncultured Prochlorococcus sp. TaxID=159733 RepID=UPI00258FD49D|nr:hypothetical protein [uncultured Prochlorococcus sp.]
MTSVRVDKSLKIEYNVLNGQRIKIGSSYSSKGIDSTAHIFTITRKMIRTTMCEDTVLSLLQSQLTHYLMVEKYGLRADRNSTNPEHVIIRPEEINSDLEKLFGKNNETLIQHLWWIINDAVATFDPTEWDSELLEEED